MRALVIFLVYSLGQVAIGECFLRLDDIQIDGKKMEPFDKHYYQGIYSNKHIQPQVVFYTLNLSGERVRKRRGVDYPGHFVRARSVRKSARNENYRGSGFDRGHIVPNADFNYSIDAARSTFVYSNVSPQDPYFNRRGTWARLETCVRNWSKHRLYPIQIIAGPVLEKDLPRIQDKDSSPSIPNAFFKIIVKNTPKGCKAKAFVLPNKQDDTKLIEYHFEIKDITTYPQFSFLRSWHKRLRFIPYTSLKNKLSEQKICSI